MSELDSAPMPKQGLFMIVGGYGSGKTEVTVNFALRAAMRGRSVSLVDLDIVNPYFRSREAREIMGAHGINVVVPSGANVYADLPIVLPEVAGLCRPRENEVCLFDVGGDTEGARVLASLATRIDRAPYALWYVINQKRPFCGTREGCAAQIEAIEASSRLTVTGLVCNTHLIGETTPATILSGWDLSREVARITGRPVHLVTAMKQFAGAPELDRIDAPMLWMDRHMLPPWQARDVERDRPLATPIGVPRAAMFRDPSGGS